MAVVKLEEIYLYTSDMADNAADQIAAQSFMDHSGIPYTRLMYSSQEQHESVLVIVNTWLSPNSGLPPVTDYPFLVYTEVHDDIPARQSPVKYLQGVEAIKTFPSIYNSLVN